jgi:RNA polymerase sigma-70 factor (ECF subfamily)
MRSRGGSRRKRGEERPWLYAIALNCLRDTARRGRLETRALERVAAEPVVLHAEHDGAAEVQDHGDRLRRALASLADEEREAIGLRFGADLSVPEIARTLNLPLTTVEGRVYRGLRKLRERMS